MSNGAVDHRPTVWLAALTGLLALAALGGAWRLLDEPSALDAAVAALDNDIAFTRASDAGAALTRASEHLEAAARDCGEGPRCRDLLTASAYARVGSATALRCARPQLAVLRNGLRRFVADLSAGRPATPPAAVAC